MNMKSRRKGNGSEGGQNDKGYYSLISFVLISILGFLTFRGRKTIMRMLFGRGHPNSESTENTNRRSFIERIFDSPFLDDNEELRLRPVSVNTYVYVFPTHQNEDGIFVKCLIENTSELATENVL
ncbi:3-hydroxy-3-methylglutaryl-coenzyme A reductase [Acrasis kona]|uniref:3-hydroxy-3-methylglutaryl-coenzyme A reductase n=1 Tax=Acrasis kona TaxID=1008807 RepID=A0AAW2Z8Q8_9EUKA